jgi:hypothetical protein
MVENESLSILSTLSDLFYQGLHYFFILDTGSTDNTVELIDEFFKSYPVHGYWTEEPFPKGDILFIDQEAYQYTRYELMSRCAWYMSEGWLYKPVVSSRQIF